MGKRLEKLKREPGLAALGLLGLLFFLYILYLAGLGEGFFLVDDEALVPIPQILQPLSWGGLRTLFTPGYHIDFYPLRDLSYFFDVHVFGARNFFWMRTHNFLWLGVILAFLYLTLRELKLGRKAAALVTGLWALHPVHAELLMWISARKDVMALGLGMMSLYAFLRSYRQKTFGTWSLLAFAASLLSKASLSALPWAVLGALLLTRTWKKTPRPARATLLVAAGLGLASSLFQSRFYSQVNDMRAFYPWSYRLPASLSALGKSLAGIFWPRVNVVDIDNWNNWLELNRGYAPLGLFFVLGVLAFTIYAWRTKKHVLFTGLLTSAALWLPTSSLLFPHKNFYSVRYFEAAWLALFLALTVHAARHLSAIMKSRVLHFAPLLLLLIAGASARESLIWEDSLEPWRKALRDSPRSLSLKKTLVDGLYNKMREKPLTHTEEDLLKTLRADLETQCAQFVAIDKTVGHPCLGFYWSVVKFPHYYHPSAALKERAQRTFDEFYRPLNPALTARILGNARFAQSLHQGTDVENEAHRWLGTLNFLTAEDLRQLQWAALCLKDLDPKSAQKFLRDELAGHRMARDELRFWIKSRVASSLQPRLSACLTTEAP